MVFLFGVLRLLRIDNGVLNGKYRAAFCHGRRTDHALGLDIGVFDRKVSLTLRKDCCALALEIIGTVSVGTYGHAFDRVIRGLDVDAVKKRTIQIQLTALGGCTVIGIHLCKKCRNGLFGNHVTGCHRQGISVSILGSVACHVAKLCKFLIGYGTGRGLKGIIPRQHRAVLQVVEDIVLISVHPVFRFDHGAVGQSDRSDVGRSGRTVNDIILRCRRFNELFSVADLRDSNTVTTCFYGSAALRRRACAAAACSKEHAKAQSHGHPCIHSFLHEFSPFIRCFEPLVRPYSQSRPARLCAGFATSWLTYFPCKSRRFLAKRIAQKGMNTI